MTALGRLPGLALSVAIVVITASTSRSIAAQMQQHDHDRAQMSAEALGRVSFPTSCLPAVQAPFQRAVALLHSFEYDAAERAFVEVAEEDSACAMAWWGVAMTQYRPIWAPPTPAELAEGRAAVRSAFARQAKTRRERDYIRAIAAYFESPAASDHRARAAAYTDAMAALHQAHPTDDEATIFYALALLGTAPPNDKSYAQQKRAAALLDGVLPRRPRHPGVAHYLIHSFDAPALAPLALDAARTYASIAPSAPHALHMPSHIFTRLGYWEESIASNLASADAARAQVARTQPGVTSFQELHALDYLVYAWLQRGDDDKARAVVERISAVQRVEADHFSAGYAIAAIPARYALERHAWTEAAAVPARETGFPWATIPYAELSSWYARGLGAARAGRVSAARDAIARLTAIRAALVAAKDPYWPTQIDVQVQAVEAWVARAERRDADAVRLMRAAADLEDATEKHPVTPGALLPSRELLGDLLLDLGRPGDALREYDASLAAAPKRLNSLSGAARAARQAQQDDTARRYYTELLSICARVESSRPILAEARAFLARH